jgi:hypothetical protein
MMPRMVRLFQYWGVNLFPNKAEESRGHFCSRIQGQRLQAEFAEYMCISHSSLGGSHVGIGTPPVVRVSLRAIRGIVLSEMLPRH